MTTAAAAFDESLVDEISLAGTAHKFTNLLFGFQKRYFKLRRGTIYYYLSKEQEKDGCRKFRALKDFTLEFDEADECRLDLRFSDECWYLRFETADEAALWRNALEAFRFATSKSAPPTPLYEVIAANEKALRSQSIPSTSGNAATVPTKPPTSPTANGTANLLNGSDSSSVASAISAAGFELFASHGPNPPQLDPQRLHALRLQLPALFSRVMSVVESVAESNGAPTLDLAVIEQSCQCCKQLSDAFRYLHAVLPSVQSNESMLSDDEWHDAIGADTSGDAAQLLDSLKQSALHEVETMIINAADESTQSDQSEHFDESPFHAEIRRVKTEQLSSALASVEEGCGWELFVKDGEMRMYKMERELDGVVVDPLKALHSVAGVTAREFIDIFFDPSLKKEWDDTLVRGRVVDELNDNLVVMHQLHKRVWPAAQRESLFWSSRSQIHEGLDEDAHSGFLVVNHDCEREDVPLTDPSCVRVGLKIAMLCQTVIHADRRHLTDEELSRADVRCRITYVAQVHPGGWLPTAALRQVYKREYPKFLRQFSAYVTKKVKDKPMRI